MLFTSVVIVNLFGYIQSQQTSLNDLELEPQKTLEEWMNLPLGTGLPITELIEAYGYKVEEHNVTTDDGYILSIHRIPNEGKKAVLLMPGQLTSGDVFLLNGNNSLGFILADFGYDVFMLSPRGTRYSLGHVNKNISKQKYFNFTITELGVKDAPAAIDYILKLTGEDKLYFIGHSMGTTIGFILCSQLPEYNEKIRLHTALAPVAYLGHLKNPIIRLLLPFIDIIKKLLEDLGLYGLFYSRDHLVTVLCNDLSPIQESCQLALDSVAGSDPRRNNLTLLPLTLTHLPKGSGLYTLIQLAQFVISNEFREYDYGPKDNLRQYGQKEPPKYNLKNITSPVALYYGSGDILATPEDTEHLADVLPNLVRLYSMPDPLWDHLTFLSGIDVHEMLYFKLIEFMKSF